jgi:hypothetical protein
MAQTAQINISVNATAGTKSVQDLSNQINKAGGSTASLRAELRQVTQELQGLEAGSARFTELSTRAGQLRDRIADTSAVISATAGNAVENFGRALGNTIQIGVAGFQALSAAQVLFGTENEEVNKSIQQMTALLNLSQAIETFGGLGDKLTEIKAGFTPLLQSLGLMATTQTEVAVATTAADAAIVGETIATQGATVATSAFATALNLIPFVAIATGIGLLAYNLLAAGDGAEKSAEEQKKLAKETAEYNKKLDEENEKLGQSAGAYLALVFQLKSTNANTKERSKLIKEINSTYGTTFKNLQDETAFQKQLNLGIKEYVALQTLKARLQGKEKERNKAIGELIKAQDKLNKFEREYAGMTQQQISDYDLRNYGVSVYADTLVKLNSEVATAEKRAQSYALAEGDLQKEIDKLTVTTDYNVKSTKNQGDAVKNTTDELKDYDSILSKIQQTQEDNRKSEEELYKQRVEVFDKSIDLVEVEQKTREEAAIKEYEAVRIAIQKELEAKKISKEEKKRLNELEKLNEQNLTKALDIENQRRQLSIQLTTFKILEENRKRIEYLKLEEKALQNEIRFGDGNTTDTKIDLFQRERIAYIQNIDTKLLRSKYANQVELKEYEDLQKQKLQILTINLNEEALNKKNIAEADYQRQLDLEKSRIEANDDLTVRLEKDRYGQLRAAIEFKDKEIKAVAEMDEQSRLNKLEILKKASQDLQSQIDKETNAKKKADLEVQKNNADAALVTFNNNVLLADDLAEIRIKTEENLNTTIVNLDAEKNTKIVEADAELNAEIKAQTIKSEDEILDEKIKRLDEYLGYAQQQFQQASSLISQFAKQQQEIRTTQLQDAIDQDKARIESQYAEGLISRQQYDNAIEQLEQKQQQQQLQIDRKNFRTEKALNIVGATIDGARAVLGAFAGTPGGIIIKSIAAALAGVFAATQIALIARQEFKAADGGIVPGDGSGEIDSVPARLAPGEAVINSQSTQAFLPLLSAINEMGGGRSFMPDLPATNAPQTFAPVFADNQRRDPIRAYVVETDITDAQKRVARIERSTRF